MAFPLKKTVSSQKGPLLGGLASLMKLKASFGKSSSTQRSPLIGGKAALEKLHESFKKPSQAKEEKKEQKIDLSLFRGKKYLRRDEIRRLLKEDWAWKITKLPAKIRSELEKQLFPKKFGNLVDQIEAGMVYKDLKDYPTTRAKAKYGMKNKRETDRTSNLLKKFLGK
jgi:hypothetical protein